MRECANNIPASIRRAWTHELVRRLIGRLIEDVVTESRGASHRGADLVRRGARRRNRDRRLLGMIASTDRAIKGSCGRTCTATRASSTS